MGTRWLCEKVPCLDLEMFDDRLIRTRRLVKSVRLQIFRISKFSKFSIFHILKFLSFELTGSQFS